VDDPNAGKITVGEWIDRWLPLQDVGISTEETREYLIRRFIRPAWGDSELGSLSTEEITKWENALPARTGISRRVAGDARSLLGTILGDAAATKPPLIPYNPAIRPRNRGRRTGRRLARAPQRVWATPLQALLVAERAALLTGRDDDFTMIVTIAYTGMRWGEAIGLEHEHAHPGEIHVEWQLREIRSAFHRLPPKDDSCRSLAWEPCLPVDLPPFLARLLARQIQGQPRNPCACVTQHGGTGLYVFLGPDGGHYRRSNYARQVFRPACDGRYEPGLGRPARLVIHETWMAEDGIPEILAEQRLGHEVPGMRGLYAHASDRMRDDLKAALQARWDDSLRARAAIHPHSPVPLLDGLLAPHRERAHQAAEPTTPRITQQDAPTPEDREKMISQIPPNPPESPTRGTRVGPVRRASDLVKDQDRRVELRGFEPLTPSMRTRCATGLRYSPKNGCQRSKYRHLFAHLAAAPNGPAQRGPPRAAGSRVSSGAGRAQRGAGLSRRRRGRRRRSTGRTPGR
jgi:integrase